MSTSFNYESKKNEVISLMESKGFMATYNDGDFCELVGCSPKVRVCIYAGEYRYEFPSRSFICVDYDESFDRVSTCPIIMDMFEYDKFLWSAIELLFNAPNDWYGRIIKQSGGLVYDPPIKEKKQRYRNGTRQRKLGW